MFDADGSENGLGLGTGHLRDEQECRETVSKALKLGYRHVDTARAYGNERVIGAAIEQSDVPREDILLATKVDSRKLEYDDVLESVAASRDALGVETIDLVYVHWPAHTYRPEDTLSAFATLRERCLVRHVGLANVTVEVLEEARTTNAAPISAIQVEMHPLCRQTDLSAYALRHGIAVVAHTPLCQGDVAGVPALSSIARQHGVTEAQVSLAWLMAKDGIVAIPGGRGEHLEENFASRSLRLDSEDIRQIEHIERTERYVDYEFAPWHATDLAE